MTFKWNRPFSSVINSILLVADLRIGLKFLFSRKVQINIRGVVSHYVFHGKNHLLLYSFLVNTIWHVGINLKEEMLNKVINCKHFITWWTHSSTISSCGEKVLRIPSNSILFWVSTLRVFPIRELMVCVNLQYFHIVKPTFPRDLTELTWRSCRHPRSPPWRGRPSRPGSLCPGSCYCGTSPPRVSPCKYFSWEEQLFISLCPVQFSSVQFSQ